MNDEQRLSIWQQNVNKSPISQHTLISNSILIKHNIDILALQEPAVNSFNQSISSKDWISIYPSTHQTHPEKTRTLTLIRASVSTDSWEQLEFPSGDVTAVTIQGEWGKLFLLNVYNNCDNNDTIKALMNFHEKHGELTDQAGQANIHVIWLGDFNRHHQFWDDPNDTRLFTDQALKLADELIDAVASAGLELALPKGMPTHIHNVTKKWTRLDQVFISDHSLELIETCETVTKFRNTKTDHLPISTILNLPISKQQPKLFRNFRQVGWEEFHDTLTAKLNRLPIPGRIITQEQLNTECDKITTVLQAVIEKEVPITEICSKSKRWWTKELTSMRRNMNIIGRRSYKCRLLPRHQVHHEHKEASKLYERTLERTKKQHWRDWLEKAEEPDI